ncbi:DUF4259 domain-containing protein [Paenibacillus sp. GSMTC-2017]|uniref:DUF4259 domain-containing protein n=1 Tax=Paenibacillus sp. GSMTC-2017 TaxID=2794350 RepID=UPI0018D5D264|nr:DUF4259 domain-containing protein [Paenibacillus sp. GSMTC-2017]MBH5316328.1 DUF4259 domain-containing protein [Paenibacillus sp. GSMTC-2017]
MGSWGIKALESDEGLDVIDFLQDNIPDHLSLELTELITLMKEEGLLGKSMAEIDFYYDNTAMALAELYLMFQETGKLDYGHEDEKKSLLTIRSFVADAESLRLILHYLTDIRDEVQDEDGIREIVELWRDSPSWEAWREYLEQLIIKIEERIIK